jgi:Tudor domain
MEEKENDFFAIYFLDYGNAQLVHLRNLCNPIPRIIYLPAQAVEMYLNGIDTSEAADTIQAKNVLVSLVKNRDLVARVVHTIPFICVDLYNTSGPTEIDVATEMIRCKATTAVRRKPFCLQKGCKEFAG